MDGYPDSYLELDCFLLLLNIGGARHGGQDGTSSVGMDIMTSLLGRSDDQSKLKYMFMFIE